jgi:hypothetical protein
MYCQGIEAQDTAIDWICNSVEKRQNETEIIR